MKTIGTHEAVHRFEELLAEVVNGETVTIAQHGRPVARLIPVRHDFAAAAKAIEEWERYRDEHNVVLGEGVTIRELIEEGRE